jgi:hypothetical protein
MYYEDVTVGYWKAVKSSGAITEVERNARLGKVRQLQDAVKRAREAANSIDVTDVRIGSQLLDYVFA